METPSRWRPRIRSYIESLDQPEFRLPDLYQFKAELEELFPNNHHIERKIQQILQQLRDAGYLEFLTRGRYRVISTSREARCNQEAAREIERLKRLATI